MLKFLWHIVYLDLLLFTLLAVYPAFIVLQYFCNSIEIKSFFNTYQSAGAFAMFKRTSHGLFQW